MQSNNIDTMVRIRVKTGYGATETRLYVLVLVGFVSLFSASCKRMKILLFTSICLLFYSLSIAQEIVSEKTFVKYGMEVKTISTRAGTYNPIKSVLTPGNETHKIRMKDSINNSGFEVLYYLEEYQNDNVERTNKEKHSSYGSSYTCEIIINRMENKRLSLFVQTPSFTQAHYIFPKENKRFKWKIFPETPFGKNVPVFLIYCERPDDDTLETGINNLFESLTSKNQLNKDEIVKQIKSLTDHYYLFLYDVLQKK